MKIVFRSLIVLISLTLITGAGLALDGLRLPEQSKDSLELDLAAKPEKVWALVSDIAGIPAWWPEWEKASLGKDEAGREVAYVVNRHDMDLLYRSEELVKGKKLVRSLYDPEHKLPYSEAWTFELLAGPKKGAGTTKLRISAEEGVKNPLFRSLAQRLHWEKKMMERFGEALSAECAKP